MVTINDVAKLANVSNATASRALRNVGSIKPETLQRVKEAASQLGYVCNMQAKALKSSKKNKVGLIISDINNEYYHFIQSEVQKLLNRIDFEMTVVYSDEDPKTERRSFRNLIGAGVSYIFFTPTCNSNEDLIELCKKNDIIVVQLFRNIYHNIPYIINDDENGSYLSTKNLIAKHKKNLLLFDVSYDYLKDDDVSPNRSKGFIKAILENSDIEGNIIRLNIKNYSKQDIYTLIEEYHPDGIITANADFGYDVIEYLAKSNKKDIAIISYDDNKWFELLEISSIKQNNKKIAEAMFEIVQKNSTDSSYLIEESIVNRKY